MRSSFPSVLNFYRVIKMWWSLKLNEIRITFQRWGSPQWFSLWGFWGLLVLLRKQTVLVIWGYTTHYPKPTSLVIVVTDPPAAQSGALALGLTWGYDWLAGLGCNWAGSQHTSYACTSCTLFYTTDASHKVRPTPLKMIFSGTPCRQQSTQAGIVSHQQHQR